MPATRPPTAGRAGAFACQSPRSARVIGTCLLLFAAVAAAQSDPFRTGLDAFHKGNYALAERAFRDALQQDPRAATFLALTQAATGRCEDAQPELTKAADRPEGEVRKLAGLALVQCRIAQDRLDDAEAVIARLRTQYPADPDVLYLAARLHMKAWNNDIHQLYEKAPASFRVNQISGEILETQGHFAEAAGEYRKAIAKSPATLNLHYRLGRALLMSSHDPANLDAARQEFEAELVLNPGDAIAHYQVAQVLLAQQKPQEAGARLARALELKPDFPEALVGLAKLRLDQQKTDEAIGLLEKAVKLQPRSEAAHYSLMMAYRNAGKMADARREKTELDKLQKVPEGEFTEFLKKLGEKPPEK